MSATAEGARFFDADPDFLEDPYPYYEAARDEGPIYQESFHGIFVVTSYDDILDISNRPDEFSSAPAAFGPWLAEILPKRDADADWGSVDLTDELRDWRVDKALEPPVLTLDPPEHTEYRSLINRLFKPGRLRDIEPRLRALAENLVDGFADRGEVEFVEAFAGPYPFLAISEVFGVPHEDQDMLLERMRRQETDAPDAELVRERILQAQAAGISVDGEIQADYTTLLMDYLRARRERPEADVLSDIANATFPDGELPELDDLQRVAGVVYGAGQETTVRLLTNGMRVLCADPDLQVRLRNEPALIENFVEEVLRFESPVKGLFRYAVRDAEVNGVKVPAGSILWLAYGAANRDPGQFECPAEFDVSRATAKHHVAFGHGPHFCPGSPLARLEGRLAFTALLERLDNLRLHPDKNDLGWVQWFVLRGNTSVHVTFDRIA
jgi:cytochrome P450